MNATIICTPELQYEAFNREEKQDRKLGNWMVCHTDLLTMFRDKHAKSARYWNSIGEGKWAARERDLVNMAQDRLETMEHLDGNGLVYI